MTESAVELAELADTVAALGAPLTRRQLQVAAMLARGFTDKQIAATYQIAPVTVRVHVVALAARLGLPTNKDTRVLIARWWWEHDLPDVAA